MIQKFESEALGTKLNNAHCVHIPGVNLTAFIIFELFTIMSLKSYHYTPEPRFQTANPKTCIRAIAYFRWGAGVL